MHKKGTKVPILMIPFLVVLLITACGGESREAAGDPSTDPEGGPRMVEDVLGREVEIPENVETIITLGSGAPRLAAYLQVMDRVVGSEEYLKEGVNLLRDYNPLHREELLTLPVVGQGGGSGQNNGFPEEIIMVDPDVILAGFDREAADELQSQTGIPVISLRHDTGLAPDSFFHALEVIGEVMGEEERAEMLSDYVNAMLLDLDERTKDVPEEEKLRAYAGAVTWNGRRGFGGTYSQFGIFEGIHALNLAENEDIEGFYEADFEKILIWDPDVIFLDPGNMDLVNEEYATNPNYFNSLRAVQEGKLYTLPSFNNAGTNFTYAFINAYFAGITLFPQEFEDIDIEEKAGEILTTFLGEDTFHLMEEAGLYYGTITLGE